jgi:predicted RNase H-like nuclease (RuvC/YqgF family)
MAIYIAMGLQSLADIARQEAERRKLLDEQGIEGKVIAGNPASSSSRGNLTLSTPSPVKSKKKFTENTSSKNQSSLRTFRNALQKLDKAIRQGEKRLESRRARLQAERWAPIKAGKITGRGTNEDIQSRLREEIEDLQGKLKELRQERADIYDEGKKAGFLPGELDGKGLMP